MCINIIVHNHQQLLFNNYHNSTNVNTEYDHI